MNAEPIGYPQEFRPQVFTGTTWRDELWVDGVLYCYWNDYDVFRARAYPGMRLNDIEPSMVTAEWARRILRPMPEPRKQTMEVALA